MSESVQVVLRKVLAIGVAAMLILTLTAIAVVKADHKRTTAIATASQAGSSSDADVGQGNDSTVGDVRAGGEASQTGAAASPGVNSAAAGGAGGASKEATPGKAAAGGGCRDANPDQGVFCDHILLGGTTVLSGPLAVYGDQGLKGALAWQTYYNTVVAPKE